MSKRESIIFLMVISGWIAITAYISFNRNYLGFGTETDFLGGFLPEAERLLSDKPLSIEFHPPLYASVLALFQYLFNDWFLSGRILTLFSYAISLITSFYFFRLLCDKVSGWGALFALMSSTSFFYYSILTTSDVFFYSLYSCTLLIAILAYKKVIPSLWILCGIFVGLVLLTRSNGFTLLTLVLLPWITTHPTKEKIRDSLYLCIGIASPIAIWAGIANFTGSPFMPHGTYANLALTYFSPTSSKVSGDARIILESQFDNLWQVITYDPIHIIKSYFIDLATLANNILFTQKLIGFPLFLFFIPGLFLLAMKKDKLILFYLFIITLSQLLLVNFKGYENRLYFFLVPIYGVALVIFCEYILNHYKVKLSHEFAEKNKAVLAAAIITLIPLSLSAYTSIKKTRQHDRELHESVKKAQEYIPEDAIIISRKPHMPFYLKGKHYYFPTVNTFPEFENELRKNTIDKPQYVYYGAQELKTRPQFKALINGDTKNSPWLTPIISSSKPGKWNLYKFNITKTIN